MTVPLGTSLTEFYDVLSQASGCDFQFPRTIADLYAPDKMSENLRTANDRNDETLERIYIGRRFKNDTERLETLFDMYTKMTMKVSA